VKTATQDLKFHSVYNSQKISQIGQVRFDSLRPTCRPIIIFSAQFYETRNCWCFSTTYILHYI